ncbi:hypothetical protein ROR02_02520 [Pararhodospirillum oryzae]|uniref:Uncharacterized protein n=1 Tax=Pararhodospirillum oryzae TaxID=478448 RepID=A0A512H3V6_9PROT|nr:hypothetical protein ROR02_02520 [Pararhodospirillum oryzae]
MPRQPEVGRGQDQSHSHPDKQGCVRFLKTKLQYKKILFEVYLTAQRKKYWEEELQNKDREEMANISEKFEIPKIRREWPEFRRLIRKETGR